MPYIKAEARKRMDRHEVPQTAGELNYTLSRIMSDWLGIVGVNYQNLHDAVGVLRDIATEIERRFVAPYEDRKRAENGEVFQEVRDALEAKREA